jgi:hypothetical protein
MIQPSEIEAKAKEFAILPANVQRDYVFGWLLFGLFTASELKDSIFLKGGNALRKGYFENTVFLPILTLAHLAVLDKTRCSTNSRRFAPLLRRIQGSAFSRTSIKSKKKVLAQDAGVPDLKVYEVHLYFRDFFGESDHIKIRVSIDFTRMTK